MTFILLALAIFAALVAFLYSWRFILFVLKKAQFNSLFNAFMYAAVGASLFGVSAWFVSLSGITS